MLITIVINLGCQAAGQILVYLNAFLFITNDHDDLSYYCANY